MQNSLNGLLFKNYMSLFSEALGLSNYKYNIPVDPEQRVYDFYYMTMVMNPKDLVSTVQSRIQGGVPGMQADVRGSALLGQGGARVEDLASALEDAQDTLLDYMYKDLLDATYFAIAAEIRHLPDANGSKWTNPNLIKFAAKKGVLSEYKEYVKNLSYINTLGVENAVADKMDLPDEDPIKQMAVRVRLYKNPLQKKTVVTKDPVTGEEKKESKIDDTKEFFDNSKSYIASYVAAKKAWKNNDVAFIEFCMDAFVGKKEGIKWNASYGGEPWSNICKGWMRLYNAEDRRNKFVWIDHIFDLAHNTGTMLNKVKRYSKNGTWDWIKKALDYKRDAVKPLFQFLSRMSPSMQYLARRVTYALTGERMDQSYFDKNGNVQVSSGLGGVKPKSTAAATGPINGAANSTFKEGSYFTTKDGSKFKVSYVGSSDKIYAYPQSLSVDFYKAIQRNYKDPTGKNLIPNFPFYFMFMVTSPTSLEPVLSKELINKPSFDTYKKKITHELSTIITGESDIAKILQGLLVSNKSSPFDPTKTNTINQIATGNLNKGGDPNQGTAQGSVPATSQPVSTGYYPHKASSTVIKHTGPAGKAGIKSLLLKDYGPYTRKEFSGYFKIQPYNKPILYFDPTLIANPVKASIKSFAPDKSKLLSNEFIGPKNDKALVSDLKFSSGVATLNMPTGKKAVNVIILKSGKIYNAVIKKAYDRPFICVDGNVEFVNCVIEPDAVGVTDNTMLSNGLILTNTALPFSGNGPLVFTDVKEGV